MGSSMLGVVAAAALVAGACAETIVYTFSGITTGTLNDVPFTNAAFVVTLTGDTDNIESGVLGDVDLYGLRTSATIQIAGLPLATVLPSQDVGVFAHDRLGAIGFWRYANADLLDLFGPEFSGYYLDTGFGPLSSLAVSSWNGLLTDEGPLFGHAHGMATFTAVPVPGPGSLFVIAVGTFLPTARGRRPIRFSLRPSPPCLPRR